MNQIVNNFDTISLYVLIDTNSIRGEADKLSPDSFHHPAHLHVIQADAPSYLSLGVSLQPAPNNLSVRFVHFLQHPPEVYSFCGSFRGVCLGYSIAHCLQLIHPQGLTLARMEGIVCDMQGIRPPHCIPKAVPYRAPVCPCGFFPVPFHLRKKAKGRFLHQVLPAYHAAPVLLAAFPHETAYRDLDILLIPFNDFLRVLYCAFPPVIRV